MDRKNEPLNIGDNQPLRQALIGSSVMDQVLHVFADSVDEYQFIRFSGNQKTPYFTERCTENANLAYMYAVATRQRFSEGESMIAQNPSLSLWYARGVIKGRFTEAEPVMLDPENGVADEYIYFMKKHTTPEVWKSFWDDINGRGGEGT
jgi:hypothetical protein